MYDFTQIKKDLKEYDEHRAKYKEYEKRNATIEEFIKFFEKEAELIKKILKEYNKITQSGINTDLDTIRNLIKYFEEE